MVKYLAWGVSILLFAQFSEAKTFEEINIKGEFIVIDGDHEYVSLELRNEYGAVREIPMKSSGKFSFKAEKNKNYILSFKKQGYISKEIIIDTHLEEELSLKEVEFNVKLFPQVSNNSELVYDHPVGLIRFVNGTEFVVEYNYDVALVPVKMNF